MFWKKGEMDKSQTTVSQPGKLAALNDTALDTLGALLRILGKYAFDLDEVDAQTIHERCEQWARHVLIATPYPGGEPETTIRGSVQQTERNWQGVREFVAQLRRRENAYVTSNFKDIRQVIGGFIQTIGKVFAEDRGDQTKITAVLNRLSNVIESNAPLETLKREAIGAISAIGQIAENRNTRHNDLLEELSGKLRSMREELNEARREMELDPLTRLYNRKAFDQQLARVFELNKLSGQPACLLMVDADHFKSINDNFGHPVGDLALKQLADCCVHVFPRKTDFVARYGGEEFAIVLQETPLEVAKMLGQRLLQAIRALCINYDNATLGITASIGIAELDPTKDISHWLQRADSALYRAKQAGRDRMEF
jgi:diguanylate cyclase (GGDEF)-like protein